MKPRILCDITKNFWPVLAFTSLLAIAPAIAGETCNGASCEVPNASQQEKDILINEQRGLWKQIHWQPDATSALATAKETGKPILAVLSVGQKGRADAPET